MPQILSAHVTHKWVDIDELELFAAKEAKSLLHAVRALPSVDECAVLKTCNRVEIYMATDDIAEARAQFKSLAGGALPHEMDGYLRYLTNQDSIRHLLRVASGLDSMIVGEDQILGQVKAAYSFALRERTVGKNLDLLFRKAINAGKKVRSETKINKGSVSLGSAAVSLAEKLLGNLEGKTVLVLGAGEMAGLVAKAMAGKRLRAIFVANRTYWRAVELAKKLNGIAIKFEQLPQYIPQSDVIISATSAPHIVLSKEELESLLGSRRREEKLLIIDISTPRNIDERVIEIPNVELRNIDGLREIARVNMERRMEEMKEAEKIIEGELESILKRFNDTGAEELVKGIYKRLARLKDEECHELLSKLSGIDEKQKTILLDFANSLINKIAAGPVAVLKKASQSGDVELLKAAAELFDLEERYVSSHEDEAPKD